MSIFEYNINLQEVLTKGITSDVWFGEARYIND